MKVLIIEDEIPLADSLKALLESKGFEVEAVYDGETGTQYAELGIYDLLITVFITGMARGVDMWAAELVLARRATNPGVTLFCAIPYEGFEKKWADTWRDLYQSILAQANGSKVFQPRFTYASFQERNRWMVDHSERVIAVFNGEKGGTKNTLDYARKAGVRVCILEG